MYYYTEKIDIENKSALSVVILQVPSVGSLERRVLEVNRKRVKVVKPGSKTSFPTTEIRGSYAPPFHVSLCVNSRYLKFSSCVFVNWQRHFNCLILFACLITILLSIKSQIVIEICFT